MNSLFDFTEHICYVQCGICNTILLVSVPCSSLSMVVTVTCGHCASLLSVNMMKATFMPLHFLSSLAHNAPGEVCTEVNNKTSNLKLPQHDDGQDAVTPNPVINKPPERRQRAPSAYNCFIKDEIRRLKAENPQMTHKEAFKTAAKNWANFPPIQRIGDGDGESCRRMEETGIWNTQVTEHSRFKLLTMKKFQVHIDGKCFPRHSVLT